MGRRRYPFVVNVDGQAALWEIGGQKEETPRYTKDGEKDPEGGDGIRYTLVKRIRLKPGEHRVFFGLPGERSFKELTVTLTGKEIRTIELKPVYNRYRYEGPRFERGVAKIEVTLKGAPAP